MHKVHSQEGLDNLDNLDHPDRVHPHWYTAGLLSAVIMGMSAFVISFNFMYGQAPMIIVLACSLSGMLLNTSLYLKDSALKLSSFYRKLNSNIENLFNGQALLSLCSALCVGFMAFRSYVDQFANLPISVASYFPLWSLSVVFSLANVISTFVLFYDDSTPDVTQSKATEQPTWRNLVASALKLKPSQMMSYAIGIFQSVMFSLANFSCMQQVLSMCLPASPLLVIGFSAALATALVVSECEFNCDKMLKLFSRSQPRARSSIDNLLISLVVLNGLANGWIALGDFRNLAAALRWAVVAIGSLVSYAVMQENIDDISSSVIDFPRNRRRFIPAEKGDTIAMVRSTLCALSYSGGLYLLQPMLLAKALVAAPLVTGPLFGLFLYTAAPVAYHHSMAFLKRSFTVSDHYEQSSASLAFEKRRTLFSPPFCFNLFNWTTYRNAPDSAASKTGPVPNGGSSETNGRHG